ncbi:Fc.00g035430.m01.CDS01 [Cosmosporella sp. VM-42]
MSTMLSQTIPTSLKFEKFEQSLNDSFNSYSSLDNSPADSLMSYNGNLPSLFSGEMTPSDSDTMNPLEMMTPESFVDDQQQSNLAPIPEEKSSSPTPDDNSNKKATKKRKSWGQVLPTPKTQLPPRKRAKTEDEKEQRRVERVLRNRRAAQSSRERKRQETEKLEERNKELDVRCQQLEEHNRLLIAEVQRLAKHNGLPSTAVSLEPFQDLPVTLSQPLFGSQGEDKSTPVINSAMDSLPTPKSTTVNPASISPQLGPVPDQPSMNALSSESDVVRPAVSNIGGGIAVTTSYASTESILGEARDPTYDTGIQGQPFDGLAIDSTHFFDDIEVPASPFATTEDDFSTNPFNQFDIGDYLNLEPNPFSRDSVTESDDVAAEYRFAPLDYDTETQISSENLFSQPPSGASI